MGNRFSLIIVLKTMAAASRGRRIAAASSAFVAAAVIMVAGTSVLAATAKPKWFGEPYNYVVLDQDVRTTLTEFGRNLGLAIVLSDAVNGRVHGRTEAKSAGDFLEQLAGANGLAWYFDGSVLHISSDKEFATRIVDAGRLTGEAVAKRMLELGLADDRFSLRTTSNANVIIVSGPPAYINVVTQLVEHMQPAPVIAGDDPRVRVFRGGVLTEVVSARPSGADQSGSDREDAVREQRKARP